MLCNTTACQASLPQIVGVGSVSTGHRGDDPTFGYLSLYCDADWSTKSCTTFLWEDEHQAVYVMLHHTSRLIRPDSHGLVAWDQSAPGRGHDDGSDERYNQSGQTLTMQPISSCMGIKNAQRACQGITKKGKRECTQLGRRLTRSTRRGNDEIRGICPGKHLTTHKCQSEPEEVSTS